MRIEERDGERWRSERGVGGEILRYLGRLKLRLPSIESGGRAVVVVVEAVVVVVVGMVVGMVVGLWRKGEDGGRPSGR